jgi:hypothetical protein
MGDGLFLSHTHLEHRKDHDSILCRYYQCVKATIRNTYHAISLNSCLCKCKVCKDGVD